MAKNNTTYSSHIYPTASQATRALVYDWLTAGGWTSLAEAAAADPVKVAVELLAADEWLVQRRDDCDGEEPAVRAGLETMESVAEIVRAVQEQIRAEIAEGR